MTTLGTASEDGCESCGHQPGCGCFCCCTCQVPPGGLDDAMVMDRNCPVHGLLLPAPQRWFLWTE